MVGKTDLLQGLQSLRKHVLVVLQFGHSHHLESLQWMEAGIIKPGNMKGKKKHSIFSFHLHSSCLNEELLGWVCKAIVNFNKAFREN